MNQGGAFQGGGGGAYSVGGPDWTGQETDEPFTSEGPPERRSGQRPARLSSVVASSSRRASPRSCARPWRIRQCPAAAIIAPLSVHRRGCGITNCSPAAAQAACISRRSCELAATPPLTTTRLVWHRRAAASVFATKTSTTAC